VNGRPQQSLDEPDIPDECANIRDMIDGYALDSLDSFERGMVEHHLRWCEACRAEADRLERVARLLPLAVPIAPAPEPRLKAALLDRIAQGDDLPAVAVEPGSNRAPQVKPAYSAGWLRYASTALIAPLALALLVMGVWANSMRTDLNQQHATVDSQESMNAAMLNGSQVQLYSVERSCPTCEGSGQLGVSESNGMGMVVGWNFDPNQQHDVWQVNSEGVRAKVCQLHVDATGAVMQMFNFPESPDVYSEVYITNENGELTYVSHLGQTASEPETPAAPT
jgi:hypothetical protein